MIATVKHQELMVTKIVYEMVSLLSYLDAIEQQQTETEAGTGLFMIDNSYNIMLDIRELPLNPQYSGMVS